MPAQGIVDAAAVSAALTDEITTGIRVSPCCHTPVRAASERRANIVCIESRNGAAPVAGLIAGKSGALYGPTTAGGKLAGLTVSDTVPMFTV